MTKRKRKKRLAGWTDRYNLQSHDNFLLNSIKRFLMENELTLTEKKFGWDNPIKVEIIIKELP